MEEKKSIYAAYEEIKAREISELMNAVRFHGGWYKFGANAPVICVNYDEGPEDVTVGSVEIQNISDHEYVIIYDTTGEDIKKDDIAYGNIDFITSSITKKRNIKVSEEMCRLCETVAELSNLLYDTLYFKYKDSKEVCAEIRRLAVESEETFDMSRQDFLTEIDEFADKYVKKEFNL